MTRVNWASLVWLGLGVAIVLGVFVLFLGQQVSDGILVQDMLSASPCSGAC